MDLFHLRNGREGTDERNGSLNLEVSPSVLVPIVPAAVLVVKLLLKPKWIEKNSIRVDVLVELASSLESTLPNIFLLVLQRKILDKLLKEDQKLTWNCMIGG